MFGCVNACVTLRLVQLGVCHSRGPAVMTHIPEATTEHGRAITSYFY